MRHKRRLPFLAVLAAVFVCSWWYFSFRSSDLLDVTLPPQVSTDEWQKYLKESESRSGAGRTAQLDALLQLSGSLERREQTDAAIACLQQIPLDAEQHGVAAALQCARLQLKQNQLRAAEQTTLQALDAAADGDADSRVLRVQLLTVIYSLDLRFESRRALLAGALDRGELPATLLTQYCFGPLIPWATPQQGKRLREMLSVSPRDQGILVAWARHLNAAGKTTSAAEILERVLQADPESLVTRAALLECCFAVNDIDRMESLLSDMPLSSDSDPFLLTQMRAEYAMAQGDWNAAKELLLRLNESQPGDPQVLHGLQRVATEQGDQSSRQRIQRQIVAIAELRMLIATADLRDGRAVAAISEAARKAGLRKEAALCDRYARAK